MCTAFAAHTQFEADRRSINITINSFGTELTKDDRAKLYPAFGKLYPEGTYRLYQANDYDAVATTCSYYPVRRTRKKAKKRKRKRTKKGGIEGQGS